MKKYISLEHAIRNAIAEQNYQGKPLDESISPVDYSKPKEVPQAFFKPVHIEPRQGSEQISASGPVRSRRNVEKEKSSETMHPNLKEEESVPQSRYRRNTPQATTDGRSNAEKWGNVGRGVLQSLTGGAERKPEDVGDMADAAYQRALRRARTPEARKALEDAKKKADEQRARISSETQQELEKQREAQKKALETPEGAGAKIATDVAQVAAAIKGAHSLYKNVKSSFFPKAAPGTPTPPKAAKGKEEINKGEEPSAEPLPAARPRDLTSLDTTGRSSTARPTARPPSGRPNIRYSAGRGGVSTTGEPPQGLPPAPTTPRGGGGPKPSTEAPPATSSAPTVVQQPSVTGGPTASAGGNAQPSVQLRTVDSAKPAPAPEAPPARPQRANPRHRPSPNRNRPVNPDKIPQPLRRVVPDTEPAPSAPTPEAPKPGRAPITPGAPEVTPIIPVPKTPKPATAPGTTPNTKPGPSVTPKTIPQPQPEPAPGTRPQTNPDPNKETPGQQDLPKVDPDTGKTTAPSEQPAAALSDSKGLAPGLAPVPVPMPATPGSRTSPSASPRQQPQQPAPGKGKTEGKPKRPRFFPFGGGSERMGSASGGGSYQFGGSTRFGVYTSGANMKDVKEEKELSRDEIKAVARLKDKREEPVVSRPSSDRNKTMTKHAEIIRKVYEEKKIIVTSNKKKEEGLGKNPLVNTEPELKHNQLDQGS